MKLRDITVCAILAALLCVLAPFSLPVGAVPISLASFAVYLLCCTVKKKYATIAVCLYVLLGAVGLPVFAGFSGGLYKLVGVTGGYIVGYIPCAFVAGLIAERLENKYVSMPLGLLCGTVLLYALGTAWFCVQTGNSVMQALGVCVLPFLGFDALKMALACAVGQVLRRRVSYKDYIIE